MVKVNQKQILDAFEFRDRLEGGPRLELSAAEVAEIVSEYILEDDSITRQAADHRLSQMSEDPDSPIVETSHGRSKTYMKKEDLRVIADGGQPPDGGPRDAEWRKVASWWAQGLITDDEILPTLKMLRGFKGVREGLAIASDGVFYMIAALTVVAAVTNWAGYASISSASFNGAAVLILVAVPFLWIVKRKALRVYAWSERHSRRMAHFWVTLGGVFGDREESGGVTMEELPL